MKIDAFLKAHGTPTVSLAAQLGHWTRERQVSDALGTQVYAGVTLADFLIGGQLNDAIPANVTRELISLFPNKASDLASARDYVAKMIMSEASFNGTIAALQGRLGEVALQANFDGVVKLASKLNQEGWDAYIEHGSKLQYVQVKVYANAHKALMEMEKVNAKLAKGLIMGADGHTPVSTIDWAVNDDIYEEVKRLAKERHLDNTVMNIGANREDLQKMARTSRDLVQMKQGFFMELLGVAATAAIMHSAINAYFVYKGTKTQAQAIEDTIYSTAVTTGAAGLGLAAEYVLAETALGIIGGPVGWVVVSGTGFYGRAILSRLSERRVFARSLEADNLRLSELIQNGGVIKTAA